MVRRIYLFLLSFVLIVNMCYSQYLPLSIEGAHWVVFSLEHENGPNHYLLSLEGDSIINDLTYLQIMRRSINSEAFYLSDFNPPYEVTPHAQLIGFLRDDTLARRSYVIRLESGELCNSGQEELLYDFSLLAGDTLSGCLFDEGLVERNLIEAITEAQVWGNTRKVYQMADTMFNYVEGIGGYAGIFSENLIFVPGYFKVLVNYCIGDYADCGIIIVSTNEQNRSDRISIYPVPAKDEITIDLSSMEEYKLRGIRIVNLLGQVLVREAYEPIFRNNLTLIINQLNSGIYVLELEMASGIRLLKKIQVY